MLLFLNSILDTIHSCCNDFCVYEERIALVKLGKLQEIIKQKIEELEGKK